MADQRDMSTMRRQRSEPRALECDHTRIQRIDPGRHLLREDALIVLAALGERPFTATMDDGGRLRGEVLVASGGSAVDIDAATGALLIESTLDQWTEATGAPPLDLREVAIGVAPVTPALRSAMRMLSDLAIVDRNWQPIHDGLLAVIFAELGSAARIGSDDARSYSPQITRAMSLIDTRMHHHLGLDDLAAAAGWSPFHFARRFKSETGESPSRYLRLRRIERAQRLIRETDDSLSDIAFLCGFSSQSQMTTAFATLLGQTPARFRKSGEARRRLVPQAGVTQSPAE